MQTIKPYKQPVQLLVILDPSALAMGLLPDRQLRHSGEPRNSVSTLGDSVGRPRGPNIECKGQPVPTQFTYTAVAVAALAIVAFLVKQFLGEGTKYLGQRFWPAMFRSRRRTPNVGELRRYASGVVANYNSHALGFLANTKVTISDVYVPLQQETDGRREDIYQSIRKRSRMVVLGAAGAGKSMLLKNSMVKWANKPADFERVPVFVELFRRNRGDDGLQDLVADALKRNGVKKPDRFVDRALEDGLLSVFFDGFDEVVTQRRADVAQEIKQFAEKWPKCQIVVTCRDAVYDFELRPDFDHEVRVASFDDAAIRRFLKLWFKSKQPNRDVRYEVEQMMAGLRASPPIMLLARTPLLLTMIASLHEADPGIGPVLPNSRAEFYEMAVSHLLRRDSELGRTRGLTTYKAGHKLMALRTVAVLAQGAVAPGTDRRTVSEDELVATIARVLARFNLESTHASAVLDEIVDRSGLLVKVDEGNLLYEFPHLTLQEYLAAMELADSPERLLALYKENPDRWRETVKLWCGGANRDCTPVVRQIFSGDDRDKLLALECLAEARQIDETVAEQVLGYFESTLDEDRTDQHLVVAALGAVAADPGPRGAALLDRLKQAALREHMFAISALAASRLRSAVETLSDLSIMLSVARVALRSMGELAIPVLAERAKAGSLEAVDDIAAVGTASAGLALAELLWEDGDVAIRAAWRLAALVHSPDVEEELVRADVTTPAGQRYDWLWEPFSHDGPTAINPIMGRVGYLIDDPDSPEIPADIQDIDPRLALPIGVRGASLYYDWRAMWESKDAEMARIASSLDVNVRDHWGNSELLMSIHKKAPAESRRLAGVVLERVAVPVRYRYLLNTLATDVLVLLASWLCNVGFQTDAQQWRTFNDNPKQPVLIRAVAYSLASILAVGPCLLGVTRATGTIFHWWPWGPTWLSWTTLAAFAVFVVGVVFFFLVVSEVYGTAFGNFLDRLNPFGDREELVLFPTLVAGLISLLGAELLSMRTLAGWVGLPVLLAATTIPTAAMIVLFRIIHRRMQAIKNPFRTLLKLDESVFRVRSTVISGRGVTS